LMEGNSVSFIYCIHFDDQIFQEIHIDDYRPQYLYHSG
jgi:hypothetical protein